MDLRDFLCFSAWIATCYASSMLGHHDRTADVLKELSGQDKAAQVRLYQSAWENQDFLGRCDPETLGNYVATTEYLSRPIGDFFK